VIEMRVEPGARAALALLSIKRIAWDHPGEHELRLLVATSRAGDRRLTLGPLWKYAETPECLAALGEFGVEPPRLVEA
jgi:hypothetical protein